MLVRLRESSVGLLTSWMFMGRGSKPLVDDDDGACLICDHPFGDSMHFCIGADLRKAG
jgi:hypothetical protein